MNSIEIREAISAFRKSRILLTAYELDVFTFIGKKSYPSEAISEALNLNKNATERLLNALVALELLEKSDGHFSNSDVSFRFLSKDSPAYLGGLMHSNHLWNTWSHLTEVVKTGVSAHPAEINDRGKEWLLPFITAMHDRAIKQTPGTTGQAGIGAGVRNLLDIGGGSGCFIPWNLYAKTADWKPLSSICPMLCQSPKRFIEKEGFSGKIEYL